MFCDTPIVSEAASMGVIGSIKSRVARGGVKVSGKAHSIPRQMAQSRRELGVSRKAEQRCLLALLLTAYRKARKMTFSDPCLARFIRYR